MPNRLASESSPYLLQHSENPVDWYPWGTEAFARARAEDKPVFLSVGYSACHWCHVMERESFEDPATAALMNELFVSVKVDREERPDVDSIYMDAVQAITGQGGWPMSVFLTPDGQPFFGGTYFPDRSRYGMPSFTEVLRRIAELWKDQRDDVMAAGNRLTQALQERSIAPLGRTGTPLSGETLSRAERGLSRAFDPVNGGFGGAPKFPQPSVLEFVLRRYLATDDENMLGMVTRTLDAMMRGGIYDQIGGGFHRYATDEIWLVPHFEKMLYDNAQLARVYLHAWQVTQDEGYRRVATETLDYLVREMLDPDGGFYSAQDADTEGEEGRFFVWKPAEIVSAVSAAAGDDSAEPAEDAALFMQAYGVTEEGNFEDSSILFAAKSAAELADDASTPADVQARIDRSRLALRSAREERVKPGLDDKVLAGWNGLTLAAFAEAARVLGRSDYRAIAERNADFVLSSMRDSRGRLTRTWKDGRARLDGYLEDYAFVADGLLELYQTTFDPRWFRGAVELVDIVLAHFADAEGGFFDTSDDHESLIVRPKSLQDGAVPSGGAQLVGVLLRLGHYTGEALYLDAAAQALAQVQPGMERAPLGFAHWLSALDLALAPPREVAVVGNDLQPLLDVVWARYRPATVVAAGPAGRDEIPLLADREPVEGLAAAYVCRQFACERPVTDPADLAVLLDECR